MNYGLYLSASGVLTNMHRQDVFANNLANVHTAGFKRDLAGIQQRAAESIEDGLGGDLANELLDKLGGGVLVRPTRVAHGQAPLEATGGALDAALTTKNNFFAVSKTDPDSGVARVYLSRDGRFTRNSDGYLVTVAGGHRVLDGEDAPIQIESNASVRLDGAGRLIQNGVPVGQLQVTEVRDPSGLSKSGQGLYAFDLERDPRGEPVDRNIRPGFVEASGVDPIRGLMEIIDATKAVTSNGNMIRYHDLLMDRAVNTLGRVA